MITKNDLVALLPDFFKEIVEYPEVMKAYAYVLNQLEGNITHLWDNQYIQTCDASTIAMYENLVGVNYDPGDTLDVRRNRVLNRLTLVAPYTERLLRDRLDELFASYEFTVDSTTCEATMVIKSFTQDGLKLFFDLWNNIAPAHIAITAYEDFLTEINGYMRFGGVVSSTRCETIG